MEILRELIQTIIVIVVLAVLVEMLLPGGDMRRYVKMVMGLLIIMAVLQAAAGVMNSRFMQDVPAVTLSDTSAPPLEVIMAAGEELAAKDRDKAAQQFSEGLSRQVLALAGMYSEVQAIDAKVVLDGENSDIKEITIVLCAADVKQGQDAKSIKDDSGVQPVVVDIDGKNAAEDLNPVQTVTPEQKKAAAKLTAVVAEFYNIKHSQVKYEFRE